METLFMHTFRPLRLPVLQVAMMALMAACGGGGGGGGGSGAPPPITNAAVGGIWNGTSTIAGQGAVQLIGLVAEDGRGHFIQLDDGTQYWGTVRSSGSAVTASFTGATNYGYVFVDGSSSGTGSFTGTIQPRSSLTGTTNFKTTAGTTTTSNMSLTYDGLYDRDSSLATIAGNYTFAGAPGSDSINVSANGTLFGQEPATGCVTNGSVKVINPSYNAYDIEYTYSNCAGVYAVLNGSKFSGIGTLDNTVAPEMAIAGLQGTVQGQIVSVVFLYQRT